MDDLESEKQLLLERDRTWAAAAREGKDVERILAFWTDDAVVMPAGQATVRGKEQIRDYISASLSMPGFQIHWESDRVELSPDGQLAYMFSRNNVKFDAPDGTQINAAGRAITVWRREPDGEWRCAVDIWNSEE